MALTVTALRSRTVDFWRRRRISAPRIDRVRWADSSADVPDTLDRHTVAVVGGGAAPKWAVLACPCGTGHTLMLPLSAAQFPRWTLDAGGLSVTPSIDSQAEGRRCHFWLRDGRVRWAADSTGGQPRWRPART